MGLSGEAPIMVDKLQVLGAIAKPLRPNGAVLKKVALGGLMLAAVGVAFFLGRQGAVSDAQADPPQAAVVQEQNYSPASGSGDYGQRVVAYIYGNVPVSRE